MENFTELSYSSSNNSSNSEKELIHFIKDSADVLADNATLVIGIAGSLGLIFTILLPYRENKKQNFRTNFFEYLRIHRENFQQIETRDNISRI